MSPVEAWQKVWVDTTKFNEKDPHSKLSCIQCHDGTGGTADQAAAHKGVVRDPTCDQKRVAEKCGTCHKDISAAQVKSLHFDSHGFDTIAGARMDPAKKDALHTVVNNHCSNCHTTCGQCHVSQPAGAGGGLISGHQFKATQAFTRTCTGCHGTRVQAEYTGLNEGVPGDVHWTQGGMPCGKCHTGDSLHGMTGAKSERYDGKPAVVCTSCHPTVVGGKDGIQQHALHGDKVACQVCHSVEYKNCYSCHTEKNDKGQAFFKTDPSVMAFKIGLNPKKSADRPWEYVVLRHPPSDPNMWDFYGKDLLTKFNDLPTWKYATPHNIQRVTPQNKSCNNCHGNGDLFLNAKDLKTYEVEANKSVIAPVPAKR
ncbi:MAG TPA: hypothetical protein VGA61_03820 [Anaerolineae bacterium]